MDSHLVEPATPTDMVAGPRPRRRTLRRAATIIFGAMACYLLISYGILPQVVKREAAVHPDLLDGARLTHTASGVPGDPLNVALVGNEQDVVRALTAAGWRRADPLSIHSSMRIVVDSVLNKPDEQAPVSDLFLFGRKEDFAFEKPVGHSPRQRHHVRFWRTDKSEGGRPIWVGAATHDIGVELSHTTEQVTHRISSAVDAERNLLANDIATAVTLRAKRWIDPFHRELQGRNGGGDPWHTDGRLVVLDLPETTP